MKNKIKLSVKRNIVDELYALHGKVGINGLVEVFSDGFKAQIEAQIAANLKEDEDFYLNIAQEAIEKLSENADNARDYTVEVKVEKS